MPLLKKSDEERGFVLPNIRICEAISVMTVDLSQINRLLKKNKDSQNRLTHRLI